MTLHSDIAAEKVVKSSWPKDRAVDVAATAAMEASVVGNAVSAVAILNASVMDDADVAAGDCDPDHRHGAF